jgi:hypothetical protein
MGRFDALLRPLSQRQLLFFFASAVLLFVYPVLKADYPFHDDVGRELLLGEHVWREQGRLSMELFQGLVSFNTHTINVFPLPMFIVLPVFTVALASLCKQYFPHSTVLECLVVLPLCYCPFFLGNLTYQYDGPMMVLALSCVMFAVSFQPERHWVRMLCCAALLALALSFYQITAHVFIGLCCVECVRRVGEGQSFKGISGLLAERVLQLLLGALFYDLTALRLYASWRGGFVQPPQGWLPLLGNRIGEVIAVIRLLINDANAWLFVFIGIVALAGLALTLLRTFRAFKPFWERMSLGVLLLIALFVLLLSVPGSILVLEDFALNPRTLMGLSCVLVLVFYCAYNALAVLSPLANVVLLIPLFWMLSFSYAYGRVLLAQKNFETSVVYSIGYDFSSRQALRDIKDFYLIPPEHGQLWVPAVAATLDKIPALRFVLSFEQITIAERLPMAGINNVAGIDSRVFNKASLGTDRVMLVNNKFYDIVRIKDVGYILMKTPDELPNYQPRW